MSNMSLLTTLDQFHSQILLLTIQSLKINTYFDNYDAERFNIDGNDYSRTFNTSERVFYFNWYFQNIQNLFNAYLMLEDEASRNLYVYLIAYRMAGHLSIKLPVDFADNKAGLDSFLNVQHSTASSLSLSGPWGTLRHFDFEYDGHRYIVDALGLVWYLFRRQYFYETPDICIKPESGDYVIDGGACLGDTAAVFSNAVGANGKVYSFDPVADHLTVLKFNINQFPLKNVVAMPYGLSDHEQICPPIILSKYASGFSTKNQVVPLRSIDNMVMNGEIEKIDFIKLDVEGAEMETLRGAQSSIHRFHPKLAISLYHKPNDLFELIQYVRNEFPFYKFYLGHYTIHQEETVLYCRE